MTDIEKRQPWYLKTWGIALVFFSVWIASLVFGFIPYWQFPEDLAGAGAFGDSFGFVNAAASSMAFAGVILTLLMQRFELKLQREELARSREQYEKMAEAQARSEKRLLLSAFLSTLDALREFEKQRMHEMQAENSTAVLAHLHCSFLNSSYETVVKSLGPDIEEFLNVSFFGSVYADLLKAGKLLDSVDKRFRNRSLADHDKQAMDLDLDRVIGICNSVDLSGTITRRLKDCSDSLKESLRLFRTSESPETGWGEFDNARVFFDSAIRHLIY